MVLDFKNSSVIGHFHHYVFDARGELVADLQGGIQSAVENQFFLRHGRELSLPPGDYRLITELNSPFYLALPQPYLDTLDHYRRAINPGNALTLICLGMFLGLGIYYATLSWVRRSLAEGMYAIFIMANMLYNGTALLVFPDLLGMHWFYLISIPILFSNCAYIVFVIALLDIRRSENPRLFWSGITLIGVMSLFILLAPLYPNWSLEFDRYGVGLFLTYGLISGITRARQGNPSARLYLFAIGAFFVLGALSISSGSLDGIYTLYIEHLGLSAVTVEIVLLALVLSYQFAQLHREREHARTQAEQSLELAYTDALTGLPNRYALEIEIDNLPHHGSLTFIDLDGLKFYNDSFGHERGDELLRCFAHQLKSRLDGHATLHRLGGDEFAITSHGGNLKFVEHMLSETITALPALGFELAGASHGSVHVHEDPDKENLKGMADSRMYQNKNQRKRRRMRDQEPEEAV